MSALLNGHAAPELAQHRGLHYGDGVFRTCLIYDSQVIDLEMQCDVVNSDAARLGIAPAPVAELAREAVQLAGEQRRGVLKITLLRVGSARGYRPDGAGTDRLVSSYGPPAFRAEAWEQGVRTFRSSLALATQPALAGIKHLNRLEQVLASRDWEQGMDEALLSDGAGRPVCGTRTNLFWVRGGALHTPALERCGVAGLMRRKVMALAAELNIATRVADFSWSDAEGADEMFLTNSLIGIWPVANCGSWARPPGAVTRRLADRLGHPRLVSA